MSKRHLILAWAERGLVTDVPAALAAANVLPTAGEWRALLDRLLLAAGVAALGAALVFFIAYNWSDLGRFAKFGLAETLLVVATLAYWKLGPETVQGKAALLLASIFLGALLALFGQTYQTGADTWQLFGTWSVLMVPWVLIGRFPGLWMLWIVVTNTAVALYFAVFPRFLMFALSTEQQLWALFAFNTAALIIWELAAKRLQWLAERWAPRLLAIASGTLATLLMLHMIFDWRETSAVALAVYPAWLSVVYWQYLTRARDLFIVAGACLSVIVVVTALLTRLLVDGGGAAAFLLVALAVVGMAGAAGWWLRRLAREA